MAMWEWFVIFFLGTMAANICLRILLGKAYFIHKALIRTGYEQGYWDGCTNIKMYHALMDNKVPPAEFLTKTMGLRLDTRDKIMKVINEITN